MAVTLRALLTFTFVLLISGSTATLGDPGRGQGGPPDNPGRSGEDHGNGHGQDDEQPSPCGAEAGDAQGVAAARAAAVSECDCAGARNHGRYVACVARTANKAFRDGTLRAVCRDEVLQCAARSTCGRPGFVTCCRTDATGTTRCSIKRNADRCRAPRDGTACVGTDASCCDACAPDGSCPSPTTTTQGPTTTTRAPTTTTTGAPTTTTTGPATTTTTAPPTTTTTTGPTTTTSTSTTTTITASTTTTTGGATTTTTASTTTTTGPTTTTTTGPTTTTTRPPTTTTTAPPTTTTTAPPTTTTTAPPTTTTTAPPTTTTTAPPTTTTAPPTTTTTAPPTTSTTVTTTTSTTTTTSPPACAPIVVGQPIANTYVLNGATGDKRCTTNAAANRYLACTTDADCGNTAGACLQLPWVTADGQIMPFPTGVATTFTVAAAGSFPTCEHAVCVPCGNPNTIPCLGIPGCEVADNPNGCVPRATQGCCNQPGFIVPTFFVNILGGLCSRVDQIACGVGVVNTSNPQTGDNEVTKNGDTSNPGPDCLYGTGDDPAPLACTLVGEGNDYNGKIVSTIGNGSADSNGIHYRLTTPELSTTWSDSQSPGGTCANGSTFDDGELLVSQLILQAQPTTAGATGSFTDMDADGCKRAGAGFIAATNPATDGPITVGPSPGPLRPQAYDGSQAAVSAAVSVVFSGPNSPIRDIGFVAITPQQVINTAPATSCSCTPTPGCPE